jgi:thioredoxin-dependent peroxiredoxin
MPRLKPGVKAPDFTAESVNKGEIKLEQYKGEMVLLNFSRYFGCPVCQLEFDELSEFLKKHSSLKVIYVNQSYLDSARRFIEGKNVDFPVIACPKVKGRYWLYDLYGVGTLGVKDILEILQKGKRADKLGKVHGPYEGVETQSPAQFIINEEDMIILANYGLFKAERLEKALSDAFIVK